MDHDADTSDEEAFTFTSKLDVMRQRAWSKFEVMKSSHRIGFLTGSTERGSDHSVSIPTAPVHQNNTSEVWQVRINDVGYNHTHYDSKSNISRTTKYTPISFLPKNLFEQFHRVANVYFLIISCLQLFTDLTPTGRITTIVPLSIVMGITAIKDMYEDWKRFRNDVEINKRECSVLRDGEWQLVSWKDVKMGDLLMIKKNELLPADVLLLSSSEKSGTCYIETSNIDGETNLKIKQAVPCTSHIRTKEDLATARGDVLAKPPNAVISGTQSFQGNLRVPADRGGEYTLQQLTSAQFLLRGAQLKNTKHVFALVLFVGKDTKMVLNSRNAPHKVSTLERLINKSLLISFATLCIICVAGASMNTRSQDYVSDAWYLFTPDTDNWAGVWVTYLLLMNNLIPLSLYITMEMCKIAHAVFIGWDLNMFDANKNMFAQAHTSGLAEELGQIDYILSDKTGTLTENQMVFKRCSIGGHAYTTNTLTQIKDSCAKVLLEPAMATPADQLVWEFVVNCFCNHTVVPELGEDKTIDLQASSPDEKALMEFIQKNVGVRLLAREPGYIQLKNDITNEELTVEILRILEFTSDRSRMSVIVKLPTGRIVLYCKGADSVLLSRLAPSKFREATQAHLDMFASDGLRTLVLAKRELTQIEFDAWNKLYQESSVSLDGDRDAKLAQAASAIEQKLELIGVSAIEDKLQEGVPSTISILQMAGIKVWVLTGDKQETAINVALSSKLIHYKSPMLLLDASKHRAMNSSLAVYEALKQAHQRFKGLSVAERKKTSLVVGGETLRHIFDSEKLQLEFLKLAKRMLSVVCCRVSPMQKAMVSNLLRKDLNKITLAIGDGANDVPMILSAHVGVGVQGNEGMQAVRASDYSISQFRFLRTLLLVHGHWSYRRIAHTALYCFYKSTVLFMVQFWFSIFNQWTGQSLFERWTQAAYNLIFTSFPIIAFGCFDIDLDPTTLRKIPTLYNAGRTNKYFSTRIYTGWLVKGLFHSFVAFFVPSVLFGALEDGTAASSIVASDGLTRGQDVMGLYSYTAVIFIVTIELLLMQKSHTLLSSCTLAASILLWFLYQIIYSRIDWNFPVAFHLFDHAADHTVFWLGVICTTVIAMLPGVVQKWARVCFYPDMEEMAIEIQKHNLFMSLQSRQQRPQVNPDMSNRKARSVRHNSMRRAMQKDAIKL